MNAVNWYSLEKIIKNIRSIAQSFIHGDRGTYGWRKTDIDDEKHLVTWLVAKYTPGGD